MPTVYYKDSGYEVKLQLTTYHRPKCFDRDVVVMDENGKWQDVGLLKLRNNLWQLRGYESVGKHEVLGVGVKRYLHNRGQDND